LHREPHLDLPDHRQGLSTRTPLHRFARRVCERGNLRRLIGARWLTVRARQRDRSMSGRRLRIRVWGLNRSAAGRGVRRWNRDQLCRPRVLQRRNPVRCRLHHQPKRVRRILRRRPSQRTRALRAQHVSRRLCLPRLRSRRSSLRHLPPGFGDLPRRVGHRPSIASADVYRV